MTDQPAKWMVYCRHGKGCRFSRWFSRYNFNLIQWTIKYNISKQRQLSTLTAMLSKTLSRVLTLPKWNNSLKNSCVLLVWNAEMTSSASDRLTPAWHPKTAEWYEWIFGQDRRKVCLNNPYVETADPQTENWAPQMPFWFTNKNWSHKCIFESCKC